MFVCPTSNPFVDPGSKKPCVDPKCRCKSVTFKVGNVFDAQEISKPFLEFPVSTPLLPGCSGIGILCLFCSGVSGPTFNRVHLKPCSALTAGDTFRAMPKDAKDYSLRCINPGKDKKFWKLKNVTQREGMWVYHVIRSYLNYYIQHSAAIADLYRSHGIGEGRGPKAYEIKEFVSSVVEEFNILEEINQDLMSYFDKGIVETPSGVDNKTTVFSNNIKALLTNRCLWTTCARSHPVIIPKLFAKPCKTCAASHK